MDTMPKLTGLDFSPENNLSKYLQDIRKYPILEPDEEYDLIMEGRDITSHVLPDAKYKFFLDASVDVRAERRFNELKEKGQNVTFEQVKEDLIERDRRDSHRELSPLILTEGTYHIDNSNMTIDEEVDLMYRTIMGEIEWD